MKTFCLLILLCVPVSAQMFPRVTIGQLPSSNQQSNQLWEVTDSLDGTCANTGGTIKAICKWNGTMYVAVMDTVSSPVSTTQQTALNLKANIASLAASATTDTTNAANIGTGALPAARIGAGSIDLATKVTGVLPFANGGISGSAATSATTGTMTVNMTTRIVSITPTGAATFNASGGVQGQTLTFVVTTSGVSSFVLTFGTNFKSAGTLATGTVTGKIFTVTFLCANGTQWIEQSRTTAQ